MKQIFFATDFSDSSITSFPIALQLADQLRANLTVLHVYDIPTVLKYPHAANSEDMEKQAIRESSRKMTELREQFPTKREINLMAVESNDVAKGILSVIAENIPDMLIVGTRGGNKVRKAIVGSTTKALIKRSPAPVLAIPENCSTAGFKKILFATDFHAVDILAIRRLINLLGSFEPEINVVHLSTQKEADGAAKLEWFKELLKQKVAYSNVSFKLLRTEHVPRELLSYLNENQFDALAMLEKKHRRLLDQLFGRGLIEKMEFQTSVPLLTFNEYFLQLFDEEAHGFATQIKQIN